MLKYSRHLLIRTPKGRDIFFELATVRNIGSTEKIKNFDNSVHFLVLKALFLQALKIASNFYLTAFLRQQLVNYVNNMIRITLNNCTIF